MYFISQSIRYHSLTCCGVAVSPCGTLIATGDFACKVMLWQRGRHSPVGVFTVPSEVRALQWHGSGCLLVGCLNGEILSCTPSLSGETFMARDTNTDAIHRSDTEHSLTCTNISPHPHSPGHGEDDRAHACVDLRDFQETARPQVGVG